MVTIFDKEWAKSEFFPEDRLIIVTWKKIDRQLSFEEYKFAFEQSLIYQSDNQSDISYFISDTRNQGNISPNFRKWFQSEAVPKAQSQGLAKAAVVMDSNVFKRYYINHIMKTLNVFKLPFKTFGTLAEAKEWLKS